MPALARHFASILMLVNEERTGASQAAATPIRSPLAGGSEAGSQLAGMVQPWWCHRGQ